MIKKVLWQNVPNINCSYSYSNKTLIGTNVTNTEVDLVNRCLRTGNDVLDQLSINKVN